MSKINRPDVLAKWVDALRSGNYRQTIEALHDNKGYCCLGVLCEVFGGTDGRWEGNEVDGYNYQYLDEIPCGGILPDKVARLLDIEPNGDFTLTEEIVDDLRARWADAEITDGQSTFGYRGVTVQDPRTEQESRIGLGIIGRTNSLSSLNDEGLGFLRIADLVEVIDKHEAWFSNSG